MWGNWASYWQISVVPSHSTFPPEMVYPLIWRTDEPAAIFCEQGSSLIVYFPGNIDSTFLRSG
jgi:hypothetical protein